MVSSTNSAAIQFARDYLEVWLSILFTELHEYNSPGSFSPVWPNEACIFGASVAQALLTGMKCMIPSMLAWLNVYLLLTCRREGDDSK